MSIPKSVKISYDFLAFYICPNYKRPPVLSLSLIHISATFSMASSEFLSARSSGRSDALKSCVYTGIAYLITVALLVLPYLLLPAGSYEMCIRDRPCTGACSPSHAACLPAVPGRSVRIPGARRLPQAA